MSRSFSPDRTIPYDIFDVPAAQGLEQAAAVLGRFATESMLPAVAIHNAGRTFEGALQNITPLLPEGMTISNERSPIALGGHGWWQSLRGREPRDGRELGWHTDKYTSSDNAVEIDYHFTGRGRARGRFIMAMRKLQTTRDEEAAMGEGRVDPARFDTRCYEIITQDHTLIVFKIGAPVAHEFVTLEEPRTSMVQFGQLALPR